MLEPVAQHSITARYYNNIDTPKERPLLMDISDIRSRFLENGISATYTIAFSPRCGSTALSNALSTFGAGVPTEYFQYPYDVNGILIYTPGETFVEKFINLIEAHNKSGIFGSKMMHDHRARLEQTLSGAIPDFCSIDDIFPRHRWIFISRANLISQAISLYIAETTNRWHIQVDEAVEAGIPEVPYDYFSILSKVMLLGAHNANWELYFSKHKITPLRLTYESLTLDPHATLSKVFKFCEYDQIDIDNVDLERDGGLQHISRRMNPIYQQLTDRFTNDFLKSGEEDDTARLGDDGERWSQFFQNKAWRAN